MRVFIFLLTVLSFSSVCFAQQQGVDSLILESSFISKKYIYKGEEIKAKDISLLMEDYPEIFDLFELSREAHFFGNFFTALGTGLILFPVATSLAKKEAHWAYALAGVGFIGISVPILRSYNKKSKEAVELYNEAISGNIQSKEKSSSLNFKISGNGVGICFKF